VFSAVAAAYEEGRTSPLHSGAVLKMTAQKYVGRLTKAAAMGKSNVG